RSISFGFNERKRLDDIGTPSITYNGSVDPLMDPNPRSVTRLEAPGCPEPVIIFNPGTCPCNVWIIEAFGRPSIVLDVTEETEVATSSLDVVLYVSTIISFKENGSSSIIVTFNTSESDTVTVTVLNPSKTTLIRSPFVTFKL